MKPRPFDYVQAETVEEALTSLAQAGEDVTVLAGGQTLIAMLNLRLRLPERTHLFLQAALQAIERQRANSVYHRCEVFGTG